MGKINCIVVDDDEIARTLLSHFISKTEYLNLSAVCSSAIEANNILQKEHDLDIMFLDVEMPEMTGLELMQALNEKNIYTILTTSKDKYAVQAFEYDVKDYLVKPINYARFLKATSKLVDIINQEDNNNLIENNLENPYLFVRANHKIVKIAPEEIEYVEALSDYIIIHTSKNKYVVHSTMKGIDQKLETFKKFARIHRSYIINMDFIESIHDIHVILNGKSIPIGRSYRNKFIEGLDVL